MNKEYSLKIEIVLMIFSVLFVVALGFKAYDETIRINRENTILELNTLIQKKDNRIEILQDLMLPLEYSQPLDQIRVSSECGIRVNPLGGSAERLHQGTDLSGITGESVYAVLAGQIV